MIDRRRRSAIAWLLLGTCLSLFLLAAVSSAFVVCLGPDGHSGLELRHGDKGCSTTLHDPGRRLHDSIADEDDDSLLVRNPVGCSDVEIVAPEFDPGLPSAEEDRLEIETTVAFDGAGFSDLVVSTTCLSGRFDPYQPPPPVLGLRTTVLLI